MNTGLRDFKARHKYLVCVDSDGCAFDTMELKHKECFCPATIMMWNLQPISKYVREAWDYVNLYSKSRGCSRFHAVVKVMELLTEREEVKNRGFQMPGIESLRRWVDTAPVHNNDAVEKLAADPIMAQTLAWSHEMNRRTGEMVRGVPPFPFVRESLERLSAVADIVIVSATPRQALLREWSEHGIDRYVTLLGAQEDGSKKEIIASVLPGHAQENAIMIGDAPGDRAAAQANGILFFPVRPGEEEDSWKEFYGTVIDRFLAGSYAGQEMARQQDRFDRCLPDVPPWKKAKT